MKKVSLSFVLLLFTSFTSAQIAAEFSGYSNIPCSGIVTFEEESIGDIVKWEWDFGDGGTSDEANPTWEYLMEGTYEVCLTVTDNLGMMDQKCSREYSEIFLDRYGFVTYEICHGETFWEYDLLLGCDDFPSSGEVIMEGGAANGCDSILYMEVICLPEVIEEIELFLCGDEQGMVDGQIIDLLNPNALIVLENISYQGCDSTILVTAVEGINISATFEAINLGCDTILGQIKATPQNGEPPYTYSWTDDNGIIIGNTPVLGELSESGYYTVQVYDDNACSNTLTTFLPNHDSPWITDTYVPLSFSNSWYNVISSFGGSVFFWHNDIGDTLVNELTYRQIFRYETNSIELIREDLMTRRVYHFQSDTIPEKLLYDFSLGIGDEFMVDNNGVEVVFIVNSIDVVEGDSGPLRRWKLQKTGGGLNIYWIEGVGGANGLFYLNTIFQTDPLFILVASFNNCQQTFDSGGPIEVEPPFETQFTANEYILSCPNDSVFIDCAYVKEAGVYMEVLKNENGCDSIVSTTVIKDDPPFSSNIIFEICEGDTLTWNDSLYFEAGSYPVLYEEGNCFYDATLFLVLLPPGIIELDQQDGWIIAEPGLNDYQWINCDTGEEIEGATSNGFIPSSAGNYQVEAVKESCLLTSECIEILLTDIATTDSSIPIKIFPNPTSSFVMIDFGQVLSTVQIQLYNNTGQVIQQYNFKNTQAGKIILEKMPQGLYLLKINTNQKETVLRKIIIQ